MISASTQDGTYPRPGMVRASWVSLDGEAGFAFDDQDRGVAQRWFAASEAFDRTISLPFSPESPASGVADTGLHRVVWYRMVLPEVETGQGARLLVHFGAVDRIADVWVDGTHVGRHEGGQTAFTFDITEALGDGRVLTLRAEDDPHDPSIPRGKQDWHEQPHSIWYHRVTGIWRSVWLEVVPDLHVVDAVWTTDPVAARITGTLTLSRSADATVEVLASLDGTTLSRVRTDTATQTVVIDLPIAALRNGQALDEFLWSPEHPRLVDLNVTVSAGGRVVDEVACYAGIRSVAVDERWLMVNERPMFLRSVLQQGYWPASHFTPPSPGAIREEVELILRLGFNSVRIHQKTEDARFLYWCDRLGLTVWLEAASAYEFSARAVERYTADWLRIVHAHRSHPSIIAWVPFNESWGIQHVARDQRQQSYSRGLAELTRALDDTRPVISNDGWEHTSSDIVTLHDYDSSAEVLGRRYASADAVAAVVDSRGPHGRRASLQPHAGRPVMVTEFGGVRYDVTPGSAEGWGYSSEASADAFEQRLAGLVGALHDSPALAGFCYTQLTDTRQERNGLCDEHRTPKLPVDVLHGIVTGTRARGGMPPGSVPASERVPAG